MNVACFAPVVISPFIGGWILNVFSYQVLFIVVLVVLLASTIPLFLSKEFYIGYTDSYKNAWSRIFKKTNRKNSLAFIFNAIETSTGEYLWPLFMAILAISYEIMGGITTFSMIMASIFTLYVGRLSDRFINRIKLLNMGSILTSISWTIKFFVFTPFTAFLAHTLYRICRASAGVPFQSLLYGKASLKGAEMDEFIIYREIIMNISRCFFFLLLAGMFSFFHDIRITFIIAAFFALGFMLFGVPPRMKILNWLRK